MKKNSGRREFIGKVGGAALAAGALPLIGSTGTASAQEIEPQSEITVSSAASKRAKKAYQLRVHAADQERAIADPGHPNNGDEALYANKIGSYSKALKHNPTTGEVDPAAYQAYAAALDNGSSAAFDALVTQGLCFKHLE